jgi:hypothetical protein
MDVRYRHNPELAWRVIDDEVVILKIKTTTYYSLDPVGSFIWRKIEEAPRTCAEVAEAMTGEFEIDRDTAGRDIEELFADLVREELLLEEAA